MNYSQLLIILVLSISFGANAQNSEERKIPNITPNNNLENPASYADKDMYKVTKAKGALVYGRDYIFEGVSAIDVTQQLIDEVDPYNYLNQFENFEKVYVDLPEKGLIMVLFPTKVTRLNEELNENE